MGEVSSSAVRYICEVGSSAVAYQQYNKLLSWQERSSAVNVAVDQIVKLAVAQ